MDRKPRKKPGMLHRHKRRPMTDLDKEFMKHMRRSITEYSHDNCVVKSGFLFMEDIKYLMPGVSYGRIFRCARRLAHKGLIWINHYYKASNLWSGANFTFCEDYFLIFNRKDYDCKVIDRHEED